MTGEIANVVDVANLTKRFGGATVVDHISLKVVAGEIEGFLGPNGSGKTTTIRMIYGLLTPDAGEDTVLGYDVIRESRRIKAEVGYMTQRFSFYEDLSIEENLFIVARLYDLAPRRRWRSAGITDSAPYRRAMRKPRGLFRAETSPSSSSFRATSGPAPIGATSRRF